MSFRSMAFTLLFFISGIACDLVNTFNQPNNQGRDIVPASTPTPEILFQDDFSDPSSGWSSFGGEEGINEYMNGWYRIFVNKANWYFWSNPGKYFEDVMIEVDAIKVSGPDQNDFGVLCRYKDDDNFYRFVLSSDGYYGISKVVEGKEKLIGMDELQLNSQVVHTGEGSSNHIRVDCIGDRLTLFANGFILAEGKDGDLIGGDIGLIAGSYDVQGVDILFDNLTVTRP